MFALLIVAICLSSAVFIFPNLLMFIDGDTDDRIPAGINMVVLAFVITVMGIALGGV